MKKLNLFIFLGIFIIILGIVFIVNASLLNNQEDNLETGNNSNEIKIVNAWHLDSNRAIISNIFEELKERDDIWSEKIYSKEAIRIEFEKPLDKNKDITVYARSESNNSRLEVYEKDSDKLIADFGLINENKKYQIYLNNLVGEQDTFDLKVVGGDAWIEFDYVIDPVTVYQFAPVSACAKTTYATYQTTTFVTGQTGCQEDKVKITASVATDLLLGYLNGTGYTTATNVTGQATGNEINMKSKNTAATGNITLVEVFPNNGTIISTLSSYTFAMTANTAYVITDLSMLNGTISQGNTFGILISISPVGNSQLETKFGAYDSITKRNIANVNEVSILPNVTALNYPTNNSYLNTNSIDFNFTASSELAFTNCSLYGDFGGTWAVNQTLLSPSINNGAVTNFTPISLSDGSYNWNVLCHDAQISPQSDWFDVNYTITFDSTNPLIDYGTGTAVDYANLTQSNVYVNVSVTETNEDTITFNLYNSSGLINSTSSTLGSRTINWTGLADGTYTYNVTANDSAGNSNSTSTRTITLDTTPPTITVVSPTNNSYFNSVNVSFNVSLNEEGSSCLFSLDDATNVTMTKFNTTYFNYPQTSLSEATHNITFSCNDTFNFLTTTDKYFFVVDTTSPNLTLNSPDDGAIVSGNNMILNSSVSDNRDEIIVKIYGGDRNNF